METHNCKSKDMNDDLQINKESRDINTIEVNDGGK
jgi:hypothetical protein